MRKDTIEKRVSIRNKDKEATKNSSTEIQNILKKFINTKVSNLKIKQKKIDCLRYYSDL